MRKKVRTSYFTMLTFSEKSRNCHKKWFENTQKDKDFLITMNYKRS